MWKCNDCGAIFSEPRKTRERVGYYGSAPADEIWLTCPECGSECIDQHDEERCRECGREISIDNGDTAYFWTDKDTESYSYGYGIMCKECAQRYAEERARELYDELMFDWEIEL